jgi:hypothetical protein
VNSQTDVSHGVAFVVVIDHQDNPELEAVWRLLQYSWNKHYQGIWQALQGYPWSPQVRIKDMHCFRLVTPRVDTRLPRQHQSTAIVLEWLNREGRHISELVQA